MRRLEHAVGPHARPSAQQQHRRELERGGQAERDATARQAKNEPDLRDRLDPRAAAGEHLADEEAPVVRDRQGRERATDVTPHSRPSSSSPRAARSPAPAGRVPPDRAGSSRSAREVVLRLRSPRRVRRPSGVTCSRAPRPSSSSGMRSIRPAWPSRAVTRLIVGRWTCSILASSDGVRGPTRSIVDRAAAWVGESPGPASWRRRRAVRVMARRRREASSGTLGPGCS